MKLLPARTLSFLAFAVVILLSTRALLGEGITEKFEVKSTELIPYDVQGSMTADGSDTGKMVLLDSRRNNWASADRALLWARPGFFFKQIVKINDVDILGKRHREVMKILKTAEEPMQITIKLAKDQYVTVEGYWRAK